MRSSPPFSGIIFIFRILSCFWEKAQCNNLRGGDGMDGFLSFVYVVCSLGSFHRCMLKAIVECSALGKIATVQVEKSRFVIELIEWGAFQGGRIQIRRFRLLAESEVWNLRCAFPTLCADSLKELGLNSLFSKMELLIKLELLF